MSHTTTWRLAPATRYRCGCSASFIDSRPPRPTAASVGARVPRARLTENAAILATHPPPTTKPTTNYQPTNYQLAYMFFRKQLEQLVKTTSYFSPRNRAAILKSGADLSATALAKADAPGWHELFLSVVMVVSFSTQLILIYIPCATPTHPPPTHQPTNYPPPTNHHPRTTNHIFALPSCATAIDLVFYPPAMALCQSHRQAGRPPLMARSDPRHYFYSGE